MVYVNTGTTYNNAKNPLIVDTNSNNNLIINANTTLYIIAVAYSSFPSFSFSYKYFDIPIINETTNNTIN